MKTSERGSSTASKDSKPIVLTYQSWRKMFFVPLSTMCPSSIEPTLMRGPVSCKKKVQESKEAALKTSWDELRKAIFCNVNDPRLPSM